MKLFVAVVCFVAVGVAQGFEKPVTLLDYFKNNGEGRIVNGSPVNPGQIPWQAAVHMTDPNGNQYLCGGSLLSPYWVLTAGHCVKGFVSWKVRLGATRIDTTESTQQIITSTYAFHHEQYDDQWLYNDVALINLPTPANMNTYVQAISLPRRSDVSDTLAGKTVQISGWGKTGDNQGTSARLLYTTTQVITNSQCQSTFGQLIISSTLCTKGSSGQSTCNGDSGGPLVYFRNGRAVHQGVVSFVSGKGCQSNDPQGYARTTSFLDWISRKTGIPIEN